MATRRHNGHRRGKNSGENAMIWVTRDHVHVDRVASPWLIRRFIDTEAQFVFLPRDKIKDFVEATGATPFDTGLGIGPDHHECDGERHCTFDALVEKYHLGDDPALKRLRALVRAADTGGIENEPRAWALELVAIGAPMMTVNDHESLELEFPLYDSLYTYFQYEIVAEEHRDQMRALRSRAERQAFAREKMAELKSRMKISLLPKTRD